MRTPILILVSIFGGLSWFVVTRMSATPAPELASESTGTRGAFESGLRIARR